MRAAAAACLALLLLLCALAVVGLHRLSALTENLDEARTRQRVVQGKVDATAAEVTKGAGGWRDEVAGRLQELGTAVDENTVHADKVARALKDTQATVEELRQTLKGLAERPRMPDDGR